MALRLLSYAADRSLWLDEAALAHGIVDRSFGALWRPLEYDQAAPIGFLYLEKLVTTVLGSGELALRLMPLIAGIAAVVAFYKLAERSGTAALLATALFALNRWLVYYSSEVKPYSVDVLVAIVLLLLAIRRSDSGDWTPRARRLGVAGMVAALLSFPALFGLAGIGAALAWLDRDLGVRPMVRRLAPVVGLWALGAAPALLMSIYGVTDSARVYLHRSWADGFARVPPHSVADLAWPALALYRAFRDLIDPTVAVVWLLAAVAGAVALWVRNRLAFVLLTAPILVTLVAGAAGFYPFSQRLVLFLVPALLLLAVESVHWLSRRQRRSARIAGVALGVVLLGTSLADARKILPGVNEELKPVLQYVRAHDGPGYTVYVYYGAAPAFRYYEARLSFDPADVIVGQCARDQWPRYMADIERLRGRRRVWFVFSHTPTAAAREDSVFLSRLDRIGRRLDRTSAPGAFAVLYDLGRSATSAPEPAIPPTRAVAAAHWSCVVGPLAPEARPAE